MEVFINKSKIAEFNQQQNVIELFGCEKLAVHHGSYSYFVKNEELDHGKQFEYSKYYVNDTSIPLVVLDRNNIPVLIKERYTDPGFNDVRRQADLNMRQQQEEVLMNEAAKVNEDINVALYGQHGYKKREIGDIPDDHFVRSRLNVRTPNPTFKIVERYRIGNPNNGYTKKKYYQELFQVIMTLIETRKLDYYKSTTGLDPLKNIYEEVRLLSEGISNSAYLDISFVTTISQRDLEEMEHAGMYLRNCDVVLSQLGRYQNVVHPGSKLVDSLLEVNLSEHMAELTSIHFDLVDNHNQLEPNRYIKIFNDDAMSFVHLKARKTGKFGDKDKGDGLYIYRRDESTNNTTVAKFIPLDKLEESGVCSSKEKAAYDLNNPDFVKYMKNKHEIDAILTKHRVTTEKSDFDLSKLEASVEELKQKAELARMEAEIKSKEMEEKLRMSREENENRMLEMQEKSRITQTEHEMKMRELQEKAEQLKREAEARVREAEERIRYAEEDRRRKEEEQRMKMDLERQKYENEKLSLITKAVTITAGAIATCYLIYKKVNS